TSGLLDSVPLENLKRFEEQLYLDLKINEEGKNIASFIKTNLVLPEKDVLDNYLNDFRKRFE
ncbi:MAG: hypothetical protein K2O05_04765, partial [Anaeroplasmataceae bacterium]|nr:hypothetical protein [Anaeroplasmataceae bacterium]